MDGIPQGGDDAQSNVPPVKPLNNCARSPSQRDPQKLTSLKSAKKGTAPPVPMNTSIHYHQSATLKAPHRANVPAIHTQGVKLTPRPRVQICISSISRPTLIASLSGMHKAALRSSPPSRSWPYRAPKGSTQAPLASETQSCCLDPRRCGRAWVE